MGGRPESLEADFLTIQYRSRSALTHRGHTFGTPLTPESLRYEGSVTHDGETGISPQLCGSRSGFVSSDIDTRVGCFRSPQDSDSWGLELRV